MDQKSFELSKEISRSKRHRSQLYWLMPLGVTVMVVGCYWMEPIFALFALPFGAVAALLAIWAKSARISELQAEKDEWDQYIDANQRA